MIAIVENENDIEQNLAELMPGNGKAQADYLWLVKSIVAGGKFATAYIRETLAAAGRTPAHLAGHCRQLRARKEAIERLGAAPAEDPEIFRSREAEIGAEARRIEQAYQQGLAKIQKDREALEAQRRAATNGRMQSRTDAERTVASTTPSGILTELGRLRVSLEEVQRRRLSREAEAWKLGDESELRNRIDAEQGRLNELLGTRGDAADGLRMIRGAIDRLRAALGRITAAKREAAELYEQETAIVAKHNEIAATVYDWRNFELTSSAAT